MKYFGLKGRIALFLGLAAILLGGVAVAWVSVRKDDPMARSERLVAAGDLRRAQIELRNVIRARPNDAAAHVQMAQVEMKLADPVAAEREFRAAQANGADPWVVMPLLGEALLAEGSNREVLEQVPPAGPTPAQSVRHLLLRNIAQLALGDKAAAAATLTSAEAVAPGSMEVALIGARMAAARGDLAETEAKLADVLSRDPAQIDALLMQEQLETAAGHAAKGLELADRAVRAAPWSAMARMRRANRLMAMGQDAKAQDDLSAVLAVQPRFIEANYLQALLLARRGKLEEAVQELDKLGAAAQRFPQALYYQGMLSAFLGRTETAIDYARRYNKLVPTDADGVRLLARAELGVRRPDRAAPLLEQAAAGQDDGQTLDLLGSAYAMMGDVPLAMRTFQQAIAIAPDDPGILAHYGVAQVQTGQAAEASTTLEHALQLSPTGNAAAAQGLVATAIQMGELDRAEAALVKLQERSGETEASGLLEGALRVRRGDLDGAQSIFAAVLRRFPGSVGATLDMAAMLAHSGQRSEAVAMLGDLLTTRPADERALTAYVTLLVQERQLPPAVQALEAAHMADPKRVGITVMLADGLTLTHDPRRAISLLKEGMERSGSTPSLLAALARAQAAAGMNGEAAASYRAMLAVRPNDIAVRDQYVSFLLRTGDVGGARASLREAAAEAPGDIRVQSNLVKFEAATAGVEKALQLSDTLRADPRNLPVAALLRGDLLMREKRFQEAVQAYFAEYRATPTAQLLMRVVGAEQSAGQLAEAEQLLREWLVQSPDTPDAIQALAQLDIRAGRFGEAEANLGAVLAKRPNDPLALNNLAWTYFLQGDKRARSVAQQAYLQAPGPDAADTLGWILVRGGDLKAGLPLLQRSGAARPSDPQVQYHLAAALTQDGQRAAAVKLLAPIVDGTAAFEDRQAAGELLAALAKADAR